MARKPTITDLARECGLGPATVDRVLHERPNVSDRARELVAQAAARLGYPVPATLSLHSRADLPKLTLGFVLHKQGQSFYQDFAREIEKACQARSDVSITPHVRFSPSQSPEDFVREMTAAAEQCDANQSIHGSMPRMISAAHSQPTWHAPLFLCYTTIGQ